MSASSWSMGMGSYCAFDPQGQMAVPQPGCLSTHPAGATTLKGGGCPKVGVSLAAERLHLAKRGNGWNQWNRSSKCNKRKRRIHMGKPPTSDAGIWHVSKMSVQRHEK
eukprot:scaffold18852_cov95-Isochrysis_galbana.AAC.4